MDVIIYIILFIIFINVIACLIHYNKQKELNEFELVRRKRFMKDYNFKIVINLLFTSIIGSLIFYLTNFLISKNLANIVFDSIFILLINDTWFYWFHRIIHENNYLRRNIHGEHHLSIKPLPLDYIYAHPFEILFGSIGMILPLIIKNINIYAYLIAVTLRNIHEIEIHTNKNTKSIIPIFNPPIKHYIHHSVGKKCNYASMFPFWDKIMGTEVLPTK